MEGTVRTINCLAMRAHSRNPCHRVESPSMNSIPDCWRWFNQARFGLFIHWGPYSVLGRGEQSLFREHLDQREYAQMACDWNPRRFDARAWATTAREAGMKYAVFTTTPS